MLCKTTMRAALAPVIGLFGVLVATTTGAQIDLTGTGDDAPKALKYAAESLHKDYSEKIARVDYYRLKATENVLRLDATTDILLPDGERYYVRYDFSGGRGVGFTRDLEQTDFSGNTVADGSGTALTASAVAYQGRRGDSTVIYQVADANADLPRDSLMSLNLSLTSTARSDHDSDGATPDVYAMPYTVLAVVGVGNIEAKVSIYDDLTDAREANGALFRKDNVTIIEVTRAVTGNIESMFDIADVATGVDDGGPFRRFVETGTGGKNSGVLGKTTVVVNHGLKDARTNENVAASIVSGIDVVATSDPGNFAVSLGEGGVLNTKSAATRTPWMLSKDDTCMSGPLMLGIENGDLDTYDVDPDGATGADAGPLKKGDLTAAGIEAATMASGAVPVGAGEFVAAANGSTSTATNYFCVLVDGNKVAIEEIGDPATKDEYELSITPTFTTADKRAIRGTEVTKDVGAIDRNGTTVHLPYLTTNREVDQRLVFVNRGADEVSFWIEKKSFNLEVGTDIMTNNLAPDMAETIPGNGRRVLRTIDQFVFSGQDRGAATVNVAAPNRDIDVMTIQRSPATGEVDTTVYQHAD